MNDILRNLGEKSMVDVVEILIQMVPQNRRNGSDNLSFETLTSN